MAGGCAFLIRNSPAGLVLSFDLSAFVEASPHGARRWIRFSRGSLGAFRRLQAGVARWRCFPHLLARRARLALDVWFVFVNSEANVADWPSRGLTAFAADLAATRIEGGDLKLPPRELWGSVEAALEHAGGAPAVSSGGARGRKRKAPP